MKLRVLTGFAVASLTLMMLTAGAVTNPIRQAASLRPDTLAGGFATADRQPVAVEMAAEVRQAGVREPVKQAADSVALLAGGMVVVASAAFAGTGMVRRRKIRH